MNEQRDPNLDPLKDNDIRFLSGLVLVAAAIICLRIAWPHFSDRRLVDLDAVPPQPVGFQVDLNSADWPEISQLPGIGETMARRIVAKRETAGPFRTLEQLDEIRGIGPKLLASIKPFLAPLQPRATISLVDSPVDQPTNPNSNPTD